MNWLDIVLLLVIAASVASSLRKGLTREVIGLAAVVLGLLLGSWFYGMAGAFLLPYVSSRSIANICGFGLVFLAVMIAGSLISALVGKLLKVSGLSVVDHLLGALFGVARGLMISVALVMAMMAFAPGGGPPAAVVHSRVAPYVVDVARVCAAAAPHELKEGFSHSYAQVKAAWSDALEKGIRGMPNTKKAQQNERDI